MFTRARAYANLTPFERSILRLVEMLLIAGLVAALPIVTQALGPYGVDWWMVGREALAAFVVAVLAALVKYLKSMVDPPLPSARADGSGGGEAGSA